MIDSAALEVADLRKAFGGGLDPAALLPAAWRPRRRPPVMGVDSVSFQVSRREIYGVIGANGSGKSTLVRILSTLLTPDSGRVAVFGHDVEREAMRVRWLINRVSSDPSFFRMLTTWENLSFFSRIYGLNGAELRERGLHILSRLGLSERRASEPMRNLSRGMQQKVALARAFLTSPVLLLLDEPTTGLDPRSKREVQEFILDMRASHDATVLLTTHDMDEAERLCDRLAFLDDGRIMAEGTPLALRQRTAQGRPLDEVSMETVFLEFTGKQLEEDQEVDHG